MLYVLERERENPRGPGELYVRVSCVLCGNVRVGLRILGHVLSSGTARAGGGPRAHLLEEALGRRGILPWCRRRHGRVYPHTAVFPHTHPQPRGFVGSLVPIATWLNPHSTTGLAVEVSKFFNIQYRGRQQQICQYVAMGMSVEDAYRVQGTD